MKHPTMHKLVSVLLSLLLALAVPAAALAQSTDPAPEQPQAKPEPIRDTINPLGPMMYFIGVGSTIIGGTLGAFSIADYGAYQNALEQGDSEAIQQGYYDSYQSKGIMSLSFMGAGLGFVILAGLLTSPYDAIPVEPDGSIQVTQGLDLQIQPSYLGVSFRPGK
ncbi:hypothetical protein [Spirochaeta lutea]|nr:hypothetical protein [Spirochaeta lutea]